MKRWIFTLLCAVALNFGVAQAQEKAPEKLVETVQITPQTRAQADKAWSEKSFSDALSLYRALLAQNPNDEELRYRVAVSLGETEQWSDAVTAGQSLLKDATGKARVLYWLGRLQLKLPDSAWKLGDVIYYGDDYPKTEKSAKPQRVYLSEEHNTAALKYLQDAKIAAQSERLRRDINPFRLKSDEEIDLNFDLAALVNQSKYGELVEVLNKRKANDAKFDEEVNVAARFDTAWSMPKQVLYLYNEIPTLDGSKDRRDSALSLLGKGLWIRAYRQNMDQWANQYDNEAKKYVKRPYPFDHLEAIPVWRELVQKYRQTDLAPQTQILIAQTRQGENDLVKARAEYQTVLELFAKSKWALDAKLAIQQIEKHEINLDTMGAQAPGKNAKLTFTSRNIDNLQFAAYPIALEKYLTKPANLKSADTEFTEFSENFGTIDQITKELGAPAATWTVKTGDKDNYQSVTQTIDTPLQTLGAYIIVARDAGAPDKLQSARLLLVSDLAILKKVDRKTAFGFIADAKSGAGQNGVNAVIKEIFYKDGSNRADYTQGQSDDAGFYDKTLTQSRENGYSGRVAVFAWSGKRYALTGNYANNYYYGYNNQRTLKLYAYTDRPVYRPAQKVYWRFLVSQQTKGGDQEAAKNQRVRISINNPRGEQLFSQVLATSEFGSINGELDLPVETPLGNYSISAQSVDAKDSVTNDGSGGAQFRVEEYKRPEFEVTIDAPDTAVKPGETVAAKINAKYYFGSPVPNATVKYTVRRRTWWADYRFPTPYDWLLDTWNVSWNPWDNQRNIGGEGSGPIVKEGTVKTDAQGNAELSFVATRDDVPQNDYYWWRRYQNPLYVIEAEVTDASRRTIEGVGQVKVSNQEYFTFLNPQRGFTTTGDRVEIEVVTRNANDKPVAAAGKMVVYRLLDGDKEEKIFEDALSIDATGRAFWKWETDTAGNFRIAWESIDGWNQKVTASTNVWVNGPQINQTQFRLSGVTIVLDKRVYEEGDTANVLLVADKPDSTVLLTQESNGEILRRDVIRIEGKSRTIEIPITHDRVPNFAIAAALVKDYEVFQAQAEVFVPPVRALLNVKVKADKAQYKPGETGTFEISATDYAGKPARGEFAVGVIDASLFYIQRDTAPDIRPFFYGERRAINVQLDSYRSGNPQARTEDDRKYLQGEAHEWTLPDDFGQLQLEPGGNYYGGNIRFRNNISPSFLHRTGSASFIAGAPPMAAPMASLSMADSAAGGGRVDALEARVAKRASNESAPLQEAKVRTNFAETALWSPAVVTENGSAKVQITFPDSLTQWHATARGITANAQVGAGESDVETKKNLLLRLQAPRFFVERDQVVLSANVHNYLKSDKRVKMTLKIGPEMKLASGASAPDGENLSNLEGWVEVKAGEEKRVNWTVDVTKAGDAQVQMTAQSDEESDAVQLKFPVLVHGVQRFAAQGGVMRQDGTQTVKINFPKERKFGSSSLNVQLNPSLAATMLDALPYLADYPYGCVEQTTSRFVPAVLVAKTLRDSGIDLQVLATRAKAYQAESQSAPIGERVKNSGYSYPKGQPNARDLQEMASHLWYVRSRTNPVFDPKELQAMIDDGLNRLYAMQRSDGGWGWWQGSSESDEYMSAYVMYGLSIAQSADVKVRPRVLARGFDYLEKQMKDEDNIHLLTAMAHSLSLRNGLKIGAVSNDARKIIAGRLFEQRARLTAYSKSLLAMALNNIGETDKAKTMLGNLQNTVKIDAENGTAHWQMNREYWYWWNNDSETNATALRAFLQIDPTNKIVPQLVKRITVKARANHWESTKDTALTVYALADYVRINRELDVDYTLNVRLNDKIARSYKVNAQNVLFFDNRFLAGDLFLQDGANTLTIEKKGRGNVYWNAYSEYFSLEEPIKASGNEIAVRRRYFSLTRNPKVKPEQENAETTTEIAPSAKRAFVPPRSVSAQPTEPEYNRTEIKDGATLKSGDLVEVELTIDSKNDYEYLVFEDMKAAGLEAQDIRSGSSWGDGLSSNVELRDEKVAFFVDNLPQGTRVLRYRMRVEIPGKFHALPTNAYAMYAPEVRAISDEMRVNVRD